MEHLNTSEDFLNFHSNLNNIIRINNHAETTDPDDAEDYDFDYDPNEMFYALNGKI